MKMFKDYTGQVFAYDDDQIAMGLADDKTAMTDSEVQAHLNPVVPDSVLADQIRFTRDSLLTQCDWTQLPDVPLPSQTRQAWDVYRQALRDVTNQATFPQSVVWPTKP